MKKGAAGAASAINNLLIEEKKIVGIVVVLFTDHINQTSPAMANADDLIALAKGAQGNGADGGIEAGNVAAPGEDADDPFLGPDVCHESIDRPFVGCRTGNYPLCREI